MPRFTLPSWPVWWSNTDRIIVGVYFAYVLAIVAIALGYIGHEALTGGVR